jgi:hypothetical protein
MAWQLYAAIGAAAAAHAGTMMSARNQKAPQYAGDVSISDAQGDAMRGNLNNSPMLEQLLGQINRSNQSQNSALLEQSMPGYANWANMLSQQARDQAIGKISAEQTANIQRKSAEAAFSTGFRGQAADYGFARNLGLAQYEATQQSTNIMQMLEGLSKVNLSSVGDFYTTTQDAIQNAIKNKSAEQAYINAKQASDNVRKNAFWGALAVSGEDYANTMKGGGQSENQMAYSTANYAGNY